MSPWTIKWIITMLPSFCLTLTHSPATITKFVIHLLFFALKNDETYKWATKEDFNDTLCWKYSTSIAQMSEKENRVKVCLYAIFVAGRRHFIAKRIAAIDVCVCVCSSVRSFSSNFINKKLKYNFRQETNKAKKIEARLTNRNNANSLSVHEIESTGRMQSS